MKMAKFLLPASLSLALSACVIDAGGLAHTYSPSDNHATRPNQHFECSNGFSVTLNQTNSSSIVLDYGPGRDRSRVTLRNASSASGERYVSSHPKAEWHEKGGQASFSFTDNYGNLTETTCQAN